MTAARITPRTLKGFRDYLPGPMLVRERLVDAARRVFRSFGFCPIDTPALEYLEILTGKGSDETDKQLYRFQDHGERWVGLRFDLTVPLARFAAQHIGQLGAPFKRYHIAPVWRGENTQRGRYREFLQCDFDALGVSGVAADAEAILVVQALLATIGFEQFTIRINHRGLLSGLLETLGLVEQATVVLRALDKLAKAGEEKVRAELSEVAGASSSQADAVLTMARLQGPAREVLAAAGEIVAESEAGRAGAARLAEVLDLAESAGVPGERLVVDPSIARGLDYYTGLVFETLLGELPGIGSVCSGGRYDNLVGVYSNQPLPGVGGSLGLDRLLAAMEELSGASDVRTPADALIVQFDRQRLGEYFALAARLRGEGFCVDVFPEPKKLAQQFKYADRVGVPLVIIAGEDEFAAGLWRVKRMRDGATIDVGVDALADQLRAWREEG